MEYFSQKVFIYNWIVILIVKNTIELVIEIKPEKKIQARMGFEPMTTAIPVQCFAN